MATKDISDIQVCRAYERYHAMIAQEPFRVVVRWPYEILMEETGECEKVCYNAMIRACGRGYIEYGVSLRAGWLTLKGRQLIAPETFSTEGESTMSIHPAPTEFTAEQLAADPILRYFHYSHLPAILQNSSRPFCDLARQLVEALPRNAERSVALRKLLEAKDAAVRANVPPAEFQEPSVEEMGRINRDMEEIENPPVVPAMTSDAGPLASGEAPPRDDTETKAFGAIGRIADPDVSDKADD